MSRVRWNEGNGTSNHLSELMFLPRASVEWNQGVKELRRLNWAKRLPFLQLLLPCKSKIHVSSLILSCIRIKFRSFESLLSFISGIPEIAEGKMLLPK